MKHLIINSCDDCPYKSHSGGFGQVMCKPTCSRKGNKLLGYVETTQRICRAVRIVAKYDGIIPEWCPLEDFQ